MNLPIQFNSLPSTGSVCEIRVSQIKEAKLIESLSANCAKGALPLYDCGLWYKRFILFYSGKDYIVFIIISMYSLDNVGVASNLIGSLHLCPEMHIIILDACSILINKHKVSG